MDSTPATEDNGTTDIPLEEPAQELPDDGEIIVPLEDENNANNIQEDTFIIDDASERQQDSGDEEEIIILDDGKASMKELEDEYYELEGF